MAEEETAGTPELKQPEFVPISTVFVIYKEKKIIQEGMQDEKEEIGGMEGR